MAQEINFEEFILSCQAEKERKYSDAQKSHTPPHDNDYKDEELLGEQSPIEVEPRFSTDGLGIYDDPQDWNFDAESTQALFYIGARGEIINKKTGATPRTASFSSITAISDESSSVRLNIPPPSVENPYKKRKFVDIRELTCEDVRQGYSKSGNCEKGYHIKLSVANRGLKDLLSVSNFTQLTEIDVSGNYLKCVRGLGVMQYLEKINASSNDIDTFIDICPMPLCLREVDFSKNCISKILNLKPFWTLTDINLSYNSLTKFEIEDPMYYLKSLDLSHNMIIRVSLNCPNLFILNLKSNCLNVIEGLERCSNLCSLNFARNQISELEPLKCFGNLVELHIERNNIDDLFEVEALKALLYLHCLWIHHNKISNLEYSRLMFIHTLPQLLSLDGEKITIQEMRDAKNLFDPSFIKLSCLDHTNTLVDRACQPSNAMFNTYCHTTSAPPIILLVGTQPSTCHKLALLLKEEFRNSIHLGGVHSTAATLEGSNRDIPVTLEAFAEMKNRGDFLTTSHILGRICGFSSSQISRATERRAVLIASVPLGTAISIKKWKIPTKLVLVLSPIAQLTARIEQEKLLDEFRRMSEEEEPPPEEEFSIEEEPGNIMDDISVTEEEQTDSIEDYDATDEQSEAIEEKFNSTNVDDIDAKFQIAYAEMDIMELYRYDDNPNRSWENRVSTADVPAYSPSNEEQSVSPGENAEANEENEYSDEEISDAIEENDAMENDSDVITGSKKSSLEELEGEGDERVESEALGEEDDDDIRSKKSSKDMQIVKKPSEQVNHDDSCREKPDIEYYNIKDPDTLVESIKKTREIYEEFHKDNPEFLQEPLDTPDVCYSYALLLYELQNKLLLVLPPTSDLPLCSEVKKLQQQPMFGEDYGEELGEYDDDITSIEYQNWMAEHRNSSYGYRYSLADRRKFSEMHRASTGEHRASMGTHRTSKDWHRTSIDKGNSSGEEETSGEEEENSTGEEETSAEEDEGSSDVRKLESSELETEKRRIKSNSLKIDHMDDVLEKLYANLDTGELNKPEEHHLHGTHEHHPKGEKKRDHRPSIDKEHLLVGKKHLSMDKEHLSSMSINEHEKSDSPQENDVAEEQSEIIDENRKSIDSNAADLRPRKSIQWIDEIKDDKSESSKSSSSEQSEIAVTHVHERKDNTCREIHDIEYHKFKHKDALVESINKTTELYAEFNRDNPGFFQQVLDASDLCNSFSRLRELALECIEAYQEKLNVPLTERKESSYAGHNTLDKAVFHEYKLQHYRNCSVAWSKGLDNFTKNPHSVPNSNDWCDLFWRKPHYPTNILDPTLPRQQHAKINRRGPMSKASPCNNFSLK